MSGSMDASRIGPGRAAPAALVLALALAAAGCGGPGGAEVGPPNQPESGGRP